MPGALSIIGVLLSLMCLALMILNTVQLYSLQPDISSIKPSERRLSHYEVLGLPNFASDELVRAAFRRKIRIHHPDKVGADKKEVATLQTQRIREAYDGLSGKKRCLYDFNMHGQMKWFLECSDKWLMLELEDSRRQFEEEWQRQRREQEEEEEVVDDDDYCDDMVEGLGERKMTGGGNSPTRESAIWSSGRTALTIRVNSFIDFASMVRDVCVAVAGWLFSFIRS
ncbi:hypothetical protein AAE478_010441 [Parahypoxylon ruwenzoriense]